MKYLFCYDISDPKRLSKIAKALDLKGFRIQKSIFTCELSKEEFSFLRNTLLENIDVNKDYLAVYKICEKCIKNGFYIGCDVDEIFESNFLIL